MVGSSPIVMVIDDDPDILEVMQLILESRGYSVALAANGAKALRLLSGGVQPDVILLDLMMPEMNGWEFHGEVAKNPAFSAIPVVILTGDGRAGEKAASLSAAGWLRKPVDLDELISVVRRFT